jgi:hypothetical protein
VLSNPRANRKSKKDSSNKTKENGRRNHLADLPGMNEWQEGQ